MNPTHSKLKSFLMAAMLLSGISLFISACNGSGTESSNYNDSTALSSGMDDNTLLGAGSTFV